METKQEMSILSTGKAVSACTSIAAVLLVVSGCGGPGRPVQITSPANNDTVWGKVLITAEPVGGRIPDGGLDFYLDKHKLGNVADPVMSTRTFEYTWDAGTLPAGSAHTIGAVTKGGRVPRRPPQAIRVTIDSAPVLTVTHSRISTYWRVVRIGLQSNWSTVLVASVGFLSGKSVRPGLRVPVLVAPNATVLLYEEEFLSFDPLPVVITYQSLIGNHARDEVAAKTARTETLAMNAVEPTTDSRELLPETRYQKNLGITTGGRDTSRPRAFPFPR